MVHGLLDISFSLPHYVLCNDQICVQFCEVMRYRCWTRVAEMTEDDNTGLSIRN